MKAYVKPYHPAPGECERFAEQADALRFQWRCPDCIHVIPSTCRCSLEFRTADLMGATTFADLRGNFTFCKYFEAA